MVQDECRRPFAGGLACNLNFSTIKFMPVTLLVERVSLEDDAPPHRRLRSFHGATGQVQWEHSREQVIEHIANRLFHYYFKKDGRAARIVLDRTADGEWFVKAEMDHHAPEVLLRLRVFNSKSPRNISSL